MMATVFDQLAGPDGLTARASTFARQEVIAASGGRLAGATRAELEELTDRFLAERTVAIVAERAVEERRWCTPELLAVEQRLVAAAVDRTGEQSRSWPPLERGSIGCSPASWPASGSASLRRQSCQPGASPRATSVTGRRSPAGRPASPQR